MLSAKFELGLQNAAILVGFESSETSLNPFALFQMI